MFEEEIRKEQDLLNELKKLNVFITCKNDGEAIFTRDGVVISRYDDYNKSYNKNIVILQDVLNEIKGDINVRSN